MKKISIIVPVYNTEKYITRCLDHLLNQTYKNIEIIVIDDCSTDNSANIVKKYDVKYNNIIFIQNKENKKTFETKRIGMEAATGDYIGFCDSDDYHEINSYEYLLNIIENGNYDMATGGYINNKNNWKMYNYQPHVYYNGELYNNYISSKESYHMSFSLFRNTIIKESLKDIDHYIKLSHAEDFLWRLIIYKYIKRSIHTGKPIYNYCKNLKSVSHYDDKLSTHIDRAISYSILLLEIKYFFNKYSEKNNDIFLNLSKRFAATLKNKLEKTMFQEQDIYINYTYDDLKNGIILNYQDEINKHKLEIDKQKVIIYQQENKLKDKNKILEQYQHSISIYKEKINKLAWWNL